jgi:hypothetical protein
MSTEIVLQRDFKQLAESHLDLRIATNAEFRAAFIKTLSDLVYSQNDEMLDKLNKSRPESLMNAVFKATEAGASFAKKEVSFIPFEIYRNEKNGGVERKVATGTYDALVIFDINFQKQQILKLENCAHFFTAEVHDGVEVLEDLTTGNCSFEGKNDVTKPTVGYYAKFVTTDGKIYDLFMSCAEIVDRAKINPQFKAKNYENRSKSVHYEKIVVRNLLKNIPKVSKELSSVLAYDEQHFTEYEELSNKHDALEAAKKAEALNTAPPAEAYEVDPKAAVEAFGSEKPKTAAGAFF